MTVPYQSNAAEDDDDDHEDVKVSVLHYGVAGSPERPPCLPPTLGNVQGQARAVADAVWTQAQAYGTCMQRCQAKASHTIIKIIIYQFKL